MPATLLPLVARHHQLGEVVVAIVNLHRAHAAAADARRARPPRRWLLEKIVPHVGAAPRVKIRLRAAAAAAERPERPRAQPDVRLEPEAARQQNLVRGALDERKEPVADVVGRRGARY